MDNIPWCDINGDWLQIGDRVIVHSDMQFLAITTITRFLGTPTSEDAFLRARGYVRNSLYQQLIDPFAAYVHPTQTLKLPDTPEVTLMLLSMDGDVYGADHLSFNDDFLGHKLSEGDWIASPQRGIGETYNDSCDYYALNIYQIKSMSVKGEILTTCSNMFNSYSVVKLDKSCE